MLKKLRGFFLVFLKMRFTMMFSRTKSIVVRPSPPIDGGLFLLENTSIYGRKFSNEKVQYDCNQYYIACFAA